MLNVFATFFYLTTEHTE